MDSFEQKVADELEHRAREVSPPPITPTLVSRVHRGQASVLFALLAAVGVMAFALIAGIGALNSPPLSGEDSLPRSADVSSSVAPSGRRVFVIDSRQGRGPAQILALANDGAQGGVVATYAAGFDPAIAVSPEGATLYVASFLPSGGGFRDTLSIIDTEAGQVRQRLPLRREDGSRGRVSTTGISFSPRMAISRDGRWLHFLETDSGSPPNLFIGTVDVATGRLLPDSAALEGCYPGIRLLIPTEATRQLAALCEATNTVRFLSLSETGALAESTEIILDAGDDFRTDENGNSLNLNRIGWGAISSNAGHIYALTRNGWVFILETAAERAVAEARIDLPDGQWISYGPKVLLSPDGQRMYLGLGSPEFNNTTAGTILTVDVTTWRANKRIQTTTPFSHLTLAPGGEQIYAMNVEEGTITLLDTVTGVMKQVLADEDGSPHLGEVPLWARADSP
jgi:hypothetical protein